MRKPNKDATMCTAEKTVGFGWVGMWRNAGIGWCLPTGISDEPRCCASRANSRPYVSDGDRFYLCRISVEMVKDKRGRPIVRTAKTLGVSPKK